MRTLAPAGVPFVWAAIDDALRRAATPSVVRFALFFLGRIAHTNAALARQAQERVFDAAAAMLPTSLSTDFVLHACLHVGSACVPLVGAHLELAFKSSAECDHRAAAALAVAVLRDAPLSQLLSTLLKHTLRAFKAQRVGVARTMAVCLTDGGPLLFEWLLPILSQLASEVRPCIAEFKGTPLCIAPGSCVRVLLRALVCVL